MLNDFYGKRSYASKSRVGKGRYGEWAKERKLKSEWKMKRSERVAKENRKIATERVNERAEKAEPD